MKKNILFIVEKWCDAKLESGLTNNYHNLFGSLKHSNFEDVEFSVIHYDECALDHGVHMDSILPKVLKSVKPNIVVVCLMNGLQYNPSLESLKKIKEFGSKLVMIWPDTGVDFTIPVMKVIGDVADLHVSLDSDSRMEDYRPKNHVFLWTPEDSKIYNKDESLAQDIPISFIGSPRYVVRQQYLSFLLSNQIPVMIRGGQREEKLTPVQYANLIKRSKMTLNFSESPGSFEQLKGRVFEALACGSLLFEKQNGITENYFTPGKDYIMFTDPNDLLNKVRYYMNNEEERKKIANQGTETFLQKYTAKHFWEEVFKRIW